ncbi:MAG TPA: hypothetical protein VMV83_16320 [Rectinemataceae bacterium]|nr:hypothetical protein [Rectinemataceae bacterium]
MVTREDFESIGFWTFILEALAAGLATRIPLDELSETVTEAILEIGQDISPEALPGFRGAVDGLICRAEIRRAASGTWPPENAQRDEANGI